MVDKKKIYVTEKAAGDSPAVQRRSPARRSIIFFAHHSDFVFH